MYFAKYIDLSPNGKRLFGFLSSFIHMRSMAIRIEDNPRDGRHRSKASTAPAPKSSIIRRLNKRLGRRASPAHVCVAVRFIA
jgi:hypothetical protein